MNHRYLIYFGYNGSKFKGFQRILKRVPFHLRSTIPGYSYSDLKTIQGSLETLLYQLRPLNEPKLTLASRTDKGVHGVNSAAAIDLAFVSEFYNPKLLTLFLNHRLQQLHLDIKINKTLAVHGEFNPRSAICRTYLYRLAFHSKSIILPSISKSKTSDETPFNSFREFEVEYYACKSSQRVVECYLPIEVQDRFSEVRELNIDKFKECLRLFEGTHNFASFTTWPSLKNFWKENVGNSDFNPNLALSHCVKTIYNLSISKVSPPDDGLFQPIINFFDFYDIQISSKSFLYNQIRRMIGAAIGVASYQNSLSQVMDMLKYPNPSKWDAYKMKLCSPNGLHLLNVQYSFEDLKSSTDDVTQLPILPTPPMNIDKFEYIQW